MVAINDDDDQKKRLTYAKRDPAKRWVYLCAYVCVTSTLIIHLKAFRLANINNKPEADVKNHLNKLREMHHVGLFQFMKKKKKKSQAALGNVASLIKVQSIKPI